MAIVAYALHWAGSRSSYPTDITEFQIPAGKVYLSPIIDCFDGLVVSWSIGTRPDAELVNTMLDAAIETVANRCDRPMVHSDRGAHYRWPGWLSRMRRDKLDEFKHWLTTTRAKVAPSSGTAKAMDYTIKRWAALIRYAETGNLPIDNNPVENTIRPIAVGKKNWLFAGSERAGKRAAAIQTLIGTARLNGLDPHAWLKDTLEKLPAWPNSRLDELLPIRQQA